MIFRPATAFENFALQNRYYTGTYQYDLFHISNAKDGKWLILCCCAVLRNSLANPDIGYNPENSKDRSFLFMDYRYVDRGS